MGKLLRRIRRVILWFISVLLILFLIVFLLLLVPGIQNLITSKAEGYLTGKLQTKVELGSVRLTFPKAVVLKDIYVEDLSGDTLLYSQKIKADVSMMALIRKKVHVNDLTLQGITGHVYRKDTLEGYNFDFIIQAFASEPDSTPKKEPDTSSAGWDIHLSQLVMDDILLSYRDNVGDIDTRLDLGSLQLRLNEMDLNQLYFDVEDLFLKDVFAFYEAPESGQRMDLVLDESQLLSNKINISEQLLDLGRISFSNTDFSIIQGKQERNDEVKHDTIVDAIEKNTQIAGNAESFQILPGWNLSLNELVFEKNSFRMDNMNFPEVCICCIIKIPFPSRQYPNISKVPLEGYAKRKLAC